jgi:hypothetical protein
MRVKLSQAIVGVLLVVLAIGIWMWGSSRLETAAPVPAGNLAAHTAAQEAIAAEPPSGERVLLGEEPGAGTAAPGLDRDRDLQVFVTDGSGAPVIGASVLVSHNELSGYSLGDSPYLYDRSIVASGTSDECGAFVVPLPLGRPFDLEVSSSGFAIERVASRYAGEVVIVRLRGASALYGRVTRAADGAAVVGATLVLFQEPSAGPQLLIPARECATDGGGGFRFDGLMPTTALVHLRPTSSDCFEFTQRSTTLSEGEDVELNIEVAVERTTRTLRGTVIDFVTRLPIADAVVHCGFKQSRTDVSGQYSLPYLPAGTSLGVSVRAAGYDVLVRELGAAETAESLERADFELHPGHRARGRVVDVGMRPIEGALVTAVARQVLSGGQGRYDSSATRSALDGRFELTNVCSDMPHVLSVRKDGFATATYLFPSDEAQTPLVEFGDVVLQPPSLVRGLVVDDLGRGIPDQPVWIVGCNHDTLRFRPEQSKLGSNLSHDGMLFEMRYRSARTDDLGRFSFADLSAGDYRVQLQRSDGYGAKVWPLPLGFWLDEGVVLEGIRIVIGSRSIGGQVTDEQGNPVPSVNVQLKSEASGRGGIGSTVADRSGRFEFEHLPAGTYTVSVFPNRSVVPRVDFAPVKVAGVQAGVRDLVIQIEAPAWIRGRVLGVADRPVADVYVSATHHGNGTSLGAITDRDGRFEIAVSPGEIVDLHVRPPQRSLGATPADPSAAQLSGAQLDDVVAGGPEVIVRLAP